MGRDTTQQTIQQGVEDYKLSEIIKHLISNIRSDDFVTENAQICGIVLLETNSSKMRSGKFFDSGLAVIIIIIVSLITILLYLLMFVNYESCEVLFKNNTVSK